MTQDNIKVAIIGSGFGVSAMAPGFRHTEGCEVVALCSGTPARVEAAARQHDIPHWFTDYRVMLDQLDLDLVAVVTPVALHHPMTLAALDKGCHVLCEKPMAMDVAEARAMTEAAHRAGVVHVIDHELRFNPTRLRMKALLDEGYVGEVYHAFFQTVGGFRADPNSPWSWWSDKAQGGGGVGASASHQVDLLRWLIGDITAVSADLNTYVKQRPDPKTGEWKPVTSDDQYSVIGRFANGAQVNILQSYVARLPGGARLEIHGAQGSLVLDKDDRLWGQRAGESGPTEFTAPDPLFDLPGVTPSVWNVSFVRLAREMVAAIREGRAPQGVATFDDGLRCQAVLDAIRRSDAERCWVDVEAV